MNKKLIIILLIGILINAVLYSQVDFTRELFDRLTGGVNDIPEINMPEYERFILDNGMVVYLSVDDQYPIVELSGFIRGGRSQESLDQAGITGMMIWMMLTGTRDMSEEEYQRYKGIHGLSFDMDLRRDIINLSANSLSEDKEHLLNLIVQTLTNPDFDAPYYNRIMQTYNSGLNQAKSDDQNLLDSYFYKLVYPEHPYSFEKDLDLLSETKDNLTVENIKAHYKSTILPNLTAIAICGDFEIEEMKTLLTEYFKDWQPSERELKTPRIVSPNPNYGRIVLVNKPDATAARIKMGYDFFDSDFEYITAFSFANRVYGGGSFSSRLTDNLRTDKGYVYSVYSSSSYNKLGGDYFIYTQVHDESVAHTIEIIKQEMNDIKDGSNPIQNNELFEEINRTNGIFPKYYINTNSLLDYMLFNTEYMGRDPNYLNEYIKEYNELDAETVNKVFDEFTYPYRCITVIVGNGDNILPHLLEKEYKVEVLEIK